MPLLPPLITSTPNNQPLYASSSGGGGGSQVLSQVGNSVFLSGGGGSVNIATTSLVAATGVKTTAMTYNSGILSTEFDGQVLVKNNLEVGEPLNPATLSVNGTVEPTSITDSVASVGTAGQVLSAGAGGSLEWIAAGGGGGSGTVTSVAVGANGLVLTGTSTVAPIISLPTATASVGQYLGTNAAGTFVVKGATVNLGTGSVSSASGSIAIGVGASAVATGGVAIGGSATANNVNSIVLNATGASVTSTASSLHVKPVVAKTTETDVLYYDATSGLVSYGAEGGGGGLPPSTVDGQYLVGEAGAFVVAGSTVHIGNGSASAGVNSVAVGVSANSDGAESVAIGHSASSIGSGVSVGHLASSQSRCVAIGENAVCPASGEAHRIAIGYNASASGANDISIGRFTNTSAGVSIAIGNSTSCSGAGGIVMGNGVIAGGVGAIAFGQSSRGGGDNSVSVGSGANSAGANSVSLGNAATATNANSLVLNATGVAVTSAEASLYVKPIISNVVPASTDILFYDPTSGLVTYDALPAPFRATNTYYVAKNGLDTNTGAFGSPWLTIQHAITALEAIPVTEATIAVITIAPGHYTENLVFTKGYMALTSMLDAQDANEITEITGSITVAIISGTNDIFNRQVIIEGMSITGNLVDTSTIGHTLYLQNCYVYASPTSVGLNQNSSVDNRTRLTNTTFVHSSATADTNALININSGDCYMTGCSISARSNAPALLIGGTGAVSRCAITIFEYAYASVAGAIVRVNNTRLSTFGQCGFVGLAGTVVALNTTSLGGAGTGVNFVQNVLTVSGIAGKAVSNTGIIYYGGNLSAPTTATGYSTVGVALPYSAM